MTTLVAGASGATGRLVVEQLLMRGEEVRVIVRSVASLPESIHQHPAITIYKKSILEMTDIEMANAVKGCDTVISCLGHTLSFKGMFGFPRRLVTDATRRLCNAIKFNQPDEKVKFILMNSSGVSNPDLGEKISFKQEVVMFLLRYLLPPHADNEKAAEYLRKTIGDDDAQIEWSAVRPDGLVNESAVSNYEIFPSPIRSAIFDAGKVSRINVGHFMAELASNIHLWNQWKGKMPVVYSENKH